MLHTRGSLSQTLYNINTIPILTGNPPPAPQIIINLLWLSQRQVSFCFNRQHPCQRELFIWCALHILFGRRQNGPALCRSSLSPSHHMKLDPPTRSLWPPYSFCVEGIVMSEKNLAESSSEKPDWSGNKFVRVYQVVTVVNINSDNVQPMWSIPTILYFYKL